MINKLNKLKKEEYIWGYELNDYELTIRYGLSSVGETERVIDLRNNNLKQALLNSAKNIRIDIESSLVDENDFFGYSNAEELEERIEEETEYLKLLSDLV